jgi:hypothetical protein
MVGHQLLKGVPMLPEALDNDVIGNIHGDKYPIVACGLSRVVTRAQWAAGPEVVEALLSKEYDLDADNWLGGEAWCGVGWGGVGGGGGVAVYRSGACCLTRCLVYPSVLLLAADCPTHPRLHLPAAAAATSILSRSLTHPTH